MGNISSVLKERSLGCILDMLRSKEQWPLYGSQLNNLALRSALQSTSLQRSIKHLFVKKKIPLFTKERNALVMNMPGVGGRVSLGLEAPNYNFPYRNSRERNGKPLWYSWLENFMDRET